MQFMPSEHQPPLPFIREADASDEMIGEGIESVKIANAIAAKADRSNFMVVFLWNAMLVVAPSTNMMPFCEA